MKTCMIAAVVLGSLVSLCRAADGDAGTGLVTNSHGGYNVVDQNVRKQEDASGTALVTNNHGGYNTIDPSVRKKTMVLPFFGHHGYAEHAIAESRKKPNFILLPVVEDVGHGQKITVFKKVYFATPEEAEAAKVSMKY